MKKTTIMTLVIMLGFAIPSLAKKPNKGAELTGSHILYGVSQMLVGAPDSHSTVYTTISNPTPVAQIIAMFYYERLLTHKQSGTSAGDPGFFLTCDVRRLASHGSERRANENPVFHKPPMDGDVYLEIISVPESVPLLRDGLGVNGYYNYFDPTSAKGQIAFTLVHPSLFTLPSNDVVEGQRELAIECVCSGLQDLGASPDTFEVFGIDCGGSEQ